MRERLSISVSPELKKQMDQHKVNWSAVASKAFANECKRLEMEERKKELAKTWPGWELNG